MTEVLGERLLSRVPFRELGFSRLFSDYCEAVPEAVSFYGSHFLEKCRLRFPDECVLGQSPPTFSSHGCAARAEWTLAGS